MMSVLRKLLFAVRHPVSALRFLQRILRSRRIRKKANPKRAIQPLAGTIGSSQSVWPALEPLPTTTLAQTADQIIVGNRCLYGHAHFSVSNVTDWHRDYLGNFSWPTDHFHEDIPYTYPKGVDIKSAWELSRLHHLILVGRAYQATRDERYASFVVQELTHWIAQNPVYFGVNWKVAMEVGIRAANMLLAYDLIRESNAAQNPDFSGRLLGSLQEHGDYILENLEIYGVRSNHYAADLCGLAWIGKLCPNLPRAQHYLTFSTRELEREIMHQFLSDGLGFEASLAYHRLVLEMIGFSALLLGLDTFSSAAQDRLAAAFGASKRVTAPDGRIPQIGDNDSGRFFITGSYFTWDALCFDHLTNLESALLPTKSALHPASTTWSFPAGGIEIRQQGSFWLAVAVPPVGQDGNGGHNHDDAGSFSIWWNNTPLIVDPGTGYYTSQPEIRNKLRAYASHNAPVINQESPQPIPELFHHGQQVAGQITDTAPEYINLTLTGPTFSAKRKIAITEQSITIDDTATGEITVLLTFAQDCKPVVHEKGWRVADVIISSSGRGAIGTGLYSSAYATTTETATLTLTATNHLHVEFTLA